MNKYGVSHKTGSAYYVTTPPEEDRDTVTGDMRRQFGEDRTSSTRQTDKLRQTDMLITILCHLYWGLNNQLDIPCGQSSRYCTTARITRCLAADF